ncbi:MAG: hypothetical protein K8T90_15945 [Planctomycetes bacterium]|nr:hypothetical protein [Planctomycetota bacterium]
MSTSCLLRPNDWKICTRVGVYVVVFGSLLFAFRPNTDAVFVALASVAWVTVAWPLWRQPLALRSWPDFCLHAVSWIFLPLLVAARVWGNDWGLPGMVVGGMILSAFDVNHGLLFNSKPTGEEA